MMILPAIDLKGGRCVRLVQGKIDSATVYDDDPLETAKAFARAGAEMIHVVDLDGAFSAASSSNRSILKEIVAGVNIQVQFGGGMRSADDVEEVVNAGVARVVLGTLAHESPDTLLSLVKRFGPKVCVGVDALDGKLKTRGWQKATNVSAVDFVRAVRGVGVERVVYTDIARDGMLTGVNVAQTCELARSAQIHVTASGGISSLDDIKLLIAANEPLVDSVIVGKALYENRFKLEDALLAAKTENQ
jgi:phosphoribosylformimino-5-aminoimidazole carboxamide ribotide isomerase